MRAVSVHGLHSAARAGYFGGFGPFAEYGDMLEGQSAPILRALAAEMEKRRGGLA